MRTPYTTIPTVRPLKKLRTLIVLVIAVALVGVAPPPSRVAAQTVSVESVVVLQPETAPMLTGTFQAVNNGFGDQTDPHIDCDLASYTNDDFFGFLSIHYFDFSTNTDHVIPGIGTDILSDVSGGIITYTEATASGPLIILFDTATKTQTVVPGLQNSHPRLGSNLVVFENRSFFVNPNQSEISVYDVTNSTVSRLTDDLLLDRNPAVSGTGKAVVWEKCQTTGLGCDIYSAIQMSPGVFTTGALTGAASEDRQPQTDGRIAVYISNRDGENDVYFQPVAGGVETRLSIPGEQRNPNITGNLITFESMVQTTAGSAFDLFVYNINAARLYRVTNTLVNETLNHVTMCNDVVRIVYAHPGVDYDVSAFTFHPPSSAEDQIDDLIEMVKSFNLPEGIENSLLTKLNDALAAIDASDIATACNCLSSFINECEGQSGKKLTEEQANQLINSAKQIQAELGCP